MSFLIVDSIVPLIYKHSFMILQKVVKDNRICSHLPKHMTTDPFCTVYLQGLVICGSSTLVILSEEREMHSILEGF